MLLRCKAEPARGGEIKRARIAKRFANHASEIAAFEPLLKREQSVLRCLRLDMDQTVAQVSGKPVEIGPPTALNRIGVLHPQNVAAIFGLGERIFALPRHPQSVARQCEREPCSACIAGACKDLAMEWLIGKPGLPTRLARL